MFISLKRGAISGVLAILLEFYAFNFVARDISIIATRSFLRQIADYALNFVIFFAVFYLILTLGAFLIKKFFKK
jgi:hypothetical protein